MNWHVSGNGKKKKKVVMATMCWQQCRLPHPVSGLVRASEQITTETRPAIYQALSSVTSFRFSLPKTLWPQAFCPPDGSLSGLSFQIFTLTMIILRGFRNQISQIISTILTLGIFYSGSGPFALRIECKSLSLASGGCIVLIGTQSMLIHACVQRLRVALNSSLSKLDLSNVWYCPVASSVVQHLWF